MRTRVLEFVKKNGIKLAIVPVLCLAVVVGYTSFQVFAHGGDTSKIHSCISPAGLIRIVDEDTNCLTGETPLDWGIGSQRYEERGATIDPFTSAATWLDVPSATLTEEFGEGEWKVSFAGVLKMSGGNGTAYTRIKITPTGGSASYAATQTYYRFQSPLPSTEASTEQIYTQALVDLPAGEVSIVPQVYGPADWSLMGDSSLMLER